MHASVPIFACHAYRILKFPTELPSHMPLRCMWHRKLGNNSHTNTYLLEGDTSDNACYQFPADIADRTITDNTTLGGARTVERGMSGKEGARFPMTSYANLHSDMRTQRYRDLS